VIGKFQIQSNTGPDLEAPTTPTNLAVTDVTENSATLNWSVSADNVGVTGYKVFLDGDLAGTSANTSFDFSGLSADTQYMASVQAFDAAGNTSGSAMISFTTLVIDNEAPTAPSNVTASDITENSARIDWGVSTDNVGVERYNIAVDGAFLGSTTTTTFNITGLVALTTYNVEVRAEDAAGNESAAGTVSFETLEGNTGGGLIAAYYFETGLQGWIDGGRNCQLQATSNSCEGVQSIKLRNGGSSARATSPALDLTGNTQERYRTDLAFQCL
jgi:chitodextrinase